MGRSRLHDNLRLLSCDLASTERANHGSTLDGTIPHSSGHDGDTYQAVVHVAFGGVSDLDRDGTAVDANSTLRAADISARPTRINRASRSSISSSRHGQSESLRLKLNRDDIPVIGLILAVTEFSAGHNRPQNNLSDTDEYIYSLSRCKASDGDEVGGEGGFFADMYSQRSSAPSSGRDVKAIIAPIEVEGLEDISRIGS